jgi:membrane protein implicated in regulation of membrane protease activity
MGSVNVHDLAKRLGGCAIVTFFMLVFAGVAVTALLASIWQYLEDEPLRAIWWLLLSYGAFYALRSYIRQIDRQQKEEAAEAEKAVVTTHDSN